MEIKSEMLDHLRDYAEKMAVEAGHITLKYFRKNIAVEFKDDKSPVTIADKETERYIRDTIKSDFPDHDIIGEEYGEDLNDSPFCWIIDPIDGTKAFIHGIPGSDLTIPNGKPIMMLSDRTGKTRAAILE